MTSVELPVADYPPHVQALEATLASLSAEARIDALGKLAWELRRLDAKRSLALADETYGLAKDLVYKPGLAVALLVRGFASSRASDFELAQTHAEEAYALFAELKDLEGMYRALNLLGIAYGQLGDLSKALKTFLETHKLCLNLDDKRGTTATLNNAANESLQSHHPPPIHHSDQGLP